jgi:archaellum component FlaC
MTNPVIQTDLADVLGQINQKLDGVGDRFNKIEVGIAKIEGEIKRLDSDISTIKGDIKEMKGSQKAQIWTLISILITAVGGFPVAVGRSVFSINP